MLTKTVPEGHCGRWRLGALSNLWIQGQEIVINPGGGLAPKGLLVPAVVYQEIPVPPWWHSPLLDHFAGGRE